MRVAELVAVVAEMQEAIDALAARIDELECAGAYIDHNPISYVATVSRQEPISRPLDVHALAAGVFDSYAAYFEDGDVWGHGTYL